MSVGHLVQQDDNLTCIRIVTISGRKITSLGVLFDFTDNDRNTTVQKVADMVNEQWVRNTGIGSVKRIYLPIVTSSRT